MKNLKLKQSLFPLAISLMLAFGSCSQQSHSLNTKGDVAYPASKSQAAWKKQLSTEQYAVLFEKATESPFSGALLHNEKQGIYHCAACSNPLFSSDMKFDSGTGWPSFDSEISGGKVKKINDGSHGMIRTEIVCANCGGHLGHLFNDGPTKTSLRYCVNSLSLNFSKADDPSTAVQMTETDTITLGGGCYWCVEAVYEMLNGVGEVISGYSGGKVKNPSYEAVCSDKTGHAEVVQIIFNPQKISVEELLKVFFTVHDPTTLNRQGADEGTQYRSVIFYHNSKQKEIAERIIQKLNQEKVFDADIVTEVSKFETFYKADTYHQDYYFQNKSNSYCQMVIQPKLEKFEKVFKEQLKVQP